MAKQFDEYEIQKRKLEKLMQNIDKPIEIPTRRQDKKFPDAPQFVRNVMGSSAGAGSGEFHVYRHLRRKELARQKHIEMEAHKEELDQKYRDKLERNRRLAEEKTAKKRAKRLKKKLKAKKKKRLANNEQNKDGEQSESDSDSEDSDEESSSQQDESRDSQTKSPRQEDSRTSQEENRDSPALEGPVEKDKDAEQDSKT